MPSPDCLLPFLIVVTVVEPHSSLPHTQVLAPLVAELNRSRDLYAFIRDMRASFKVEVRLKQLGFALGVESPEKVSERARLVKEAIEGR